MGGWVGGKGWGCVVQLRSLLYLYLPKEGLMYGTSHPPTHSLILPIFFSTTHPPTLAYSSAFEPP